MTNGSPASNRIVDLLRYKAEQHQRRLNFDEPASPRPALATITPFRPLSADAIRHRERMIKHLRATK